MASSTLEERLAHQFYEWEIIGRGLYLSSDPVELEPAFRPFFGHYDPAPPPVVYDDARKPTFLSSLSDRVVRWATGRSAEEESTEDAADDEPVLTAFRSENEDQLVEFSLALPSDTDVRKSACEQFLLSLGHLARPIGFEIVGTSESITLQLACGQSDVGNVREQLRAFFPDLQVSETSGYIARLLRPETERSTATAEFGLASEFMRPIRCYEKFDPDPLAGIIGAVSTLTDDECAILQILFQPAVNPWPESMIRAVTDGTGKSFFVDDPDLVRATGQKVSAPLYATVIRVAVQSSRIDRTWSVADSISSALGQFSDPTANQLAPILLGQAVAQVPLTDFISRQSRRTGMLLNSHELLSLVHLPSSSVRSQKLKREDRKTKAPPALAAAGTLILGQNHHGSQSIDVGLSPEQRSRHLYLIGASGTGKSTLLLNMIVQDIEQGNGVAVLDPHGDLIDQIVERVPEHRREDVVLFDPSDEEYPIGFNMLSAHSELERNLLASDLISVFRRLSTSWGDQMNSVFGNAVLAFLESSIGGTLSDLRRFLVESEFRSSFLQTVRDPEVVYYWRKEFPLLSGRPQGPILTRLDTFLRPKLIRHIVSQRENRLDFGAIMNDRKIFLAKLSQGLIGEENSYLLGTLLVAKMNQMAMSRQNLARSERTPFYLYVDEFHNFVTPSMEAILSGARKYNLGLVLAHQNLQQLVSRDSDVASSVIANPYTRICFRLGDYDAKKLEDGFSYFKAKDLQNLGLGEAICRMERSEYDFNLKTMPPRAVEQGTAQLRRERLLTSSREKYAIRRAEIDRLAVATTLPPPNPTRVPKSADFNEARQPVAAIPPPQPAAPVRKAPSTPGRGGPQHKYLQELIKRWGESKGFRATIEKQILGGLGSVDVVLEKEGTSIAVEISMTTSPEHEFGNVQKCLAAAFTTVVIVSNDIGSLAKIQALARDLPRPELERVKFLVPEDFFKFVENTDTSESTTRGYKVRITKTSQSAAEERAKSQLIAKTILRSAKRLL